LYALALAERGARVVVNDYGGNLEGQSGTIARAQAVANEINESGGSAIADQSDVSTQQGVATLVSRAKDAFGTVHILVNNAGITGKMSPHDNVDGPAFMRVLEISVLGTTLMTSACYSIMAQQKYGRIINVSSNAIYGFGAGGDCAYGASKGATFAITRELGRWSERDGIKINCVRSVQVKPFLEQRTADNSLRLCLQAPREWVIYQRAPRWSRGRISTLL
jgi:NAD(P)-dependent dehydrogenase (short-subunit alcohol dehydrogenase family)